MIGIGTLVNTAAVILGSATGLLFRKGLKPRFEEMLMKTLGLATIFVGLSGALPGLLQIQDGKLESQDTMLMIASLVLGALLGELIQFEHWLDRAGMWLKRKVKQQDNALFVDGFVNATLVTCVGAMAIVGALEDGMHGNSSILLAKSALDFFIVLIFASAMGAGPLFAAAPIFVYQGLITLAASRLAPLMGEAMIANVSSIGSVLIFAIGVNLAFGKKFKVGNLLPAILIPVVWELFQRLFVK